MFDFISQVIVSVGIAIGSFFGLYNEPQVEVGSTNLIAGSTYTLSGGGVSSSATSITLSSFTIPQTGQKIQDSDLSSTFYLTIEPGNRSRQEVVSCTTVTQNSTTATLSGCSRGISPVRPYIASTTLQFAHAGGTQVIFSDPPNVFDEMANVQNTTVISGQWQFTTLPTSSVAATQAHQFINKAYGDALSITGSPTSTFAGMGQVRLATKTQLAAGTASSTDLNNQPLVIPSIFASSTPISGFANNIVPVTDTNGFLSSLFIATTSNYTWTGLHSFVAATSTNLGVTSAFNWNGLSFTIGGTRAASSTVLKENGSGGLSFGVENNQVLSLVTGINTSTSATATTTLGTVVIPANTLNTSNMLRITGQWYSNNDCWADLSYGNGSTPTTTIGFVHSGTSGQIVAYLNATSTTAELATSVGTGNYDVELGPNAVISNIITGGKFMAYTNTSKTYLSFGARSPSGSDVCKLLTKSVELLTSQ